MWHIIFILSQFVLLSCTHDVRDQGIGCVIHHNDCKLTRTISCFALGNKMSFREVIDSIGQNVENLRNVSNGFLADAQNSTSLVHQCSIGFYSA